MHVLLAGLALVLTSGSFMATVTLTDEQVTALRQGKLYLQLHGDKGLAPDGANLGEWFLR